VRSLRAAARVSASLFHDFYTKEPPTLESIYAGSMSLILSR
jgi:hypothetical protein